jgi:hypothetical protein
MAALRVNTTPITTVAVTLNTYEVTCAQCQRKKWPSLPEPPTRYTCVLCRSGAGASRRYAARQRWQARAARRDHPPRRKG